MLIAPLFLLGLLGIALPWWLHRLETQITEREKFSTTRFLEASKKRIHVQRKLRYLLLMAVRMAFLALLAIAFARPILFDDPSLSVSDDTIHHVIVLDTSFSMREGERMNNAREQAADIIGSMGGDDIGSLYSASSSVTTLADPDDDKEALTALLSTAETDNGRLDLGMMMSSLDALIRNSQGSITLHIISDFQQTGQALRFADMIPDVINNRPVTLAYHQVVTDNAVNYTIESIIIEDRSTVFASLRSFNVPADSQAEVNVSVQINNIAVASQSIMVSNSGVQVLEFSDIEFAEGDNRVDLIIDSPDALVEDNARHSVFDNSPPAPVLLLTNDVDSLGVTYISAALETAPRGYEVQAVSVEEFDARIMQRYPWLVIEDIGIISGGLEAALQDYINGGGAVLAAAGELTARLGSIPVLGNSIGSPRLTPNGRPVKLQITRIDTAHPALADSNGWSNVNVRALPVSINEQDRVLIAQNQSSPVLIERAIGAGRIMLFTAGLDNSSADLPVKPVFVTFMAEVARYLSKEQLLVREQVSDSYLQLTRSGGSSGQVTDPDGNSLLSLQDTTQTQDVQLNKTGYYQVFTPAGEVLVAVNPDIRESDLTLMPAQALQNWQNAVSGASGSNASANIDDSTEQGAGEADPDEIEIWRFFLILMAILVLAESLLGNRYLNLKTGTA